ncbi:TIGR03084 family metal-binding protein [Kordiimonas pumila]|uniref:TIGR03084 family metal-binding protein n=1 Tax=Kordiimonas pumila TaxID=2161677 RepID=A0ABV7D2M2_9PROT|nr:TIGR03084 family metal-binding protein [Kordiimonas pumila]
MNKLAADLMAEYSNLANLCETLSAEQWSQHTDFYGWTPWDEIAHLLFFDEAALWAINDVARFGVETADLGREIAAGEEMSGITRRRYNHLAGPKLLALWRQRHEKLVATLRDLDPKTRVPWYGPSMSARSFATARLMETWAHGQDIWDMLGQERTSNSGLKHITHLGVTTYTWTFINRKLVVPEPVPYVNLQAPNGEQWAWGEPSEQNYVQGPALDFALLVTQRRNREDTKLTWAGDAADQWTQFAQCFAGEPADSPPAGVRVSHT